MLHHALRSCVPESRKKGGRGMSDGHVNPRRVRPGASLPGPRPHHQGTHAAGGPLGHGGGLIFPHYAASSAHTSHVSSAAPWDTIRQYASRIVHDEAWRYDPVMEFFTAPAASKHPSSTGLPLDLLR